jgi:sec-independent protein translocase protein TatB
MPQIGWFEILVIVILSILIIGPKDFPIVLRKLGNWISSVKNYFTKIQNEATDFENEIEDSFSVNSDLLKENNKKKDKNER